LKKITAPSYIIMQVKGNPPSCRREWGSNELTHGETAPFLNLPPPPPREGGNFDRQGLSLQHEKKAKKMFGSSM